jgi:hypothetical protein
MEADVEELETFTTAEIDEIFAWLRDDDEIPWGYVAECCESRAHRMCMRIDEKFDKKRLIKKAWFYYKGFYRPNFKGHNWAYHVAPLLLNKDDAEEYVLDPSTAQRPMMSQEWANLLSGSFTPEELPRHVEWVAWTEYMTKRADGLKLGMNDPVGELTKQELKKHRQELASGRGGALESPAVVEAK